MAQNIAVYRRHFYINKISLEEIFLPLFLNGFEYFSTRDSAVWFQ